MRAVRRVEFDKRPERRGLVGPVPEGHLERVRREQKMEGVPLGDFEVELEPDFQ